MLFGISLNEHLGNIQNKTSLLQIYYQPQRIYRLGNIIRKNEDVNFDILSENGLFRKYLVTTEFIENSKKQLMMIG